MTNSKIRWLTTATAFMMTLPACAGNELGALGDVLGGVLNPAGGAGGAQQGEVLVEVESVNTQQRSIQVRTDQGERGAVLYDESTVVVYQQQQYPVTALERGDVALMQIQQIDQNRIYASRIDVQQSVQERDGQAQQGSGQLIQMSGRVGVVDHQRGFFDLQTQQGTYTVFVPSSAGAANTEYFHRLQTGSSVTVEGTLTDTSRLNLHRFI